MAIRISNAANPEHFRKTGLCEGKRIAAPVCGLARNDTEGKIPTVIIEFLRLIRLPVEKRLQTVSSPDFLSRKHLPEKPGIDAGSCASYNKYTNICSI